MKVRLSILAAMLLLVLSAQTVFAGQTSFARQWGDGTCSTTQHWYGVISRGQSFDITQDVCSGEGFVVSFTTTGATVAVYDPSGQSVPLTQSQNQGEEIFSYFSTPASTAIGTWHVVISGGPSKINSLSITFS